RYRSPRPERGHRAPGAAGVDTRARSLPADPAVTIQTISPNEKPAAEPCRSANCDSHWPAPFSSDVPNADLQPHAFVSVRACSRFYRQRGWYLWTDADRDSRCGTPDTHADSIDPARQRFDHRVLHA